MDQSHNQTLNSFARGPSLWSLKKKKKQSTQLPLAKAGMLQVKLQLCIFLRFSKKYLMLQF
jgi:hypothetical protein